MEIFLLLVVILLLIIFHSAKNSKIRNLEKKLSNIEEYLKRINFNQFQQTVTPKTEVEPIKKPVTDATPINPVIIPKVEEPVIKPVNDIKPPVIEPEKKPVEQIIPPVINVEEKIAEIRINQPPVKPKPPVVQKAGWYESFRKNNPDLEKFIGENILSKVAITILVIGIAFFVKFAIDKEWINEIARVGIGILCGGIVLGFAHRLHKKFKAFSSVLVAGGIAIFYFTIGIAFHQYHLFSQTAAFVIMLLITAFSVFISIIYDRVELAALSLIGGFATPFMVSTGQGNYMVLFIYVLILDLGMLVLAYLRKWNLVNILAYFFTVVLYMGWLQTKVIGAINPPYKGAMIFAAIFYVVFVLMNIINNVKEKRKFGAMELSILISNTFLFYGEGMQVLHNYHPELKGLFSLLMALFNLVCSWLLYKKLKSDNKLVYLMIGLTLTFITLVAPVQLQGNYITVFWALEAVLLVWLAQKSGIALYRFASCVITVLMCFSLFMDWAQVYTQYNEAPLTILLNKGFITGFVSSFALLATVLLLQKETETVKALGIPFNPKVYGKLLAIGFIVLLYFTGLFELVYQLNERLYYTLPKFIIVGSYHLLFFSLLNIVGNMLKNKAAIVTLYVFNFINVVMFVLCFTLFPLMDFRENILNDYDVQIGFVFHYITIACLVFVVYQMHRAIRNPENKIAYSKALNTVLISVGILYVSSVELILHIFKITLPGIYANMNTELSDKYTEYDIAMSHIVKIGFPILWGVLAFIFLFIGMKKSNKTFRVVSLVLIALILLKLFTYDIKDASEAGKIVAFIILGVVLLIISFMYQKIKALLLDDTVTKEEPEINPEENI